MKIVHIIGGGDVGGAKTHVLSLVQRLSADMEVILVSLRDGKFADDARYMGINTVIFGAKNPIKLIKSLVAFVKSENFDIIHCHGSKANVMGVFIKKFLKKPVVTTVHSDYRRDYMGNIIKKATNGLLNTAALRMIDYYTAVSDSFADMLIGRGFDPYRIFTIYHGMSFESGKTPLREKPGERAEYLRGLGLDYRDGDVVVGIAARLHPVKDISTLITAFAAASDANPKLKLLIGGDGEELEKLTRLAQKTGVSDKVCFCGWIDDMDTFLGAVDINTLTSLTESFPYSVLEGIRCGCATVCSRVGGMPALIDHGANGYIFTPGNAKELAGYIEAFASDAALRKSFAQKLSDRARSRYSIDAMAKTQTDIYETVLCRTERKKTKRRDIVLCGAYGRNNLGDEAIMESIIAELRTVDPHARICVITKEPRRMSIEYRVNTLARFNIIAQISRLLKTRLYINGGGTLIQDASSTRSLLYYLASIRFARLCGAKVMLYGCGIGPVSRKKNRRRVGRVINACAGSLTLRDRVSVDEAAALGISKPEIILAADPAIKLAPADGQAVDSAFFAAGIPQGEYICYALREWTKDMGVIEKVARAADYAAENYGLIPVFIPMSWPADLEIAYEVRRRMKNKAYVFENKLNCREAIGVLGRMRMVVAMRLHALVFAVSQGVAVVGLSYDIKVESFLRYTGNNSFIKLDELDYEKLCEMTAESLGHTQNTPTPEMSVLFELEKNNIETAKKYLV